MVIWHEQIIAILTTMTGCDRAAGDVARRALADAERLPKAEAWFRSTAAERGYAESAVTEVWETIKEFGAYGFCRAHAVAFAVPAVQSAWLKAHHPAAFHAGLFEHDPGMWPIRVLVQDARRLGVPVLAVDVNASRTFHAVEPAKEAASGWGVRLALSTVRGITTAEAHRLADGQPYTSLHDLFQRAPPSCSPSASSRSARSATCRAPRPGATCRSKPPSCTGTPATERRRMGSSRSATPLPSPNRPDFPR